MESLPSLDQKAGFQSIRDLPPSLLNATTGLHLPSRCPYVMDRCKTEVLP
jgi:ABC-type dipeptide/oligopeptide/nickel transport system ATPase component